MINRYRARLRAALAALIVAAALAPLAAVHAAPSADYFVSYALSGPAKNVVMDASNRVWFTMPSSDKIGRFDIGSSTVQYYPAAAGSQPYDLVLSGGFVWFTMYGTNKVARLDPSSGVIEEHQIPTADSKPTGIGLGSGGVVWFVEQSGNKLGKFDPGSNTFLEYDYPQAGAQLEDLAVDQNGNVWVTVPGLGQIAQFIAADNLNGPHFSDPAYVGPASRPLGIVIDGDNMVWITAAGLNRIGRYAPGTLELWKWYTVPVADGGPTGLTVKTTLTTNTIWYTLKNANSVGYLQTLKTGAINGLHVVDVLPTTNSQPWGIAVTNDGNVWTAPTAATTLVEWQAPFFNTLHSFLPLVEQN